MIKLPPLVLASGSPQRQQILRSVGWEFTNVAPDVDETERQGESPEDYVQRLAVEKAKVVSQWQADKIVLGADTTVVVDDQILGKPTDIEDARRMLKMLAGRWHDVLTGVAIVKNGSMQLGLERTAVKFIEMSDAEIEFLALMGDPLDKAGAYAVQAQAALFIDAINGDYWNIVGLPIKLVYKLQNSGVTEN